MIINFKSLASVGLFLTPIPIVAHAEIYLTQEQAVKIMFPKQNLKPRKIELSDENVKFIENQSRETVRNKILNTFVSAEKQIVFIDQALGKHEFITYAVGVSADAKVVGVEILEYRETYGQQVKNAEWRNQFVDKNSQSTLQVGKDIKNISGATLSSTHVTNGVRRILKTYDAIRNTL